MKRAALVLILFISGCASDNNQRCLEAGTKSDIADLTYRDPSTGQCQSFGEGCDSTCGPCPLSDVLPDWGTCNGACESLTETQCLATADCHAAYQDDSAAHPVFWGCWDMPATTLHGSCTNLDAQTCSEHDDCSSLFTGPVNQPPNFVPSFESCQPEGMQVGCATVTTETACLARADCDPIYNGTNCTCDPHGCTCQDQTFDRCQ
jgi:hypothetical protein